MSVTLCKTHHLEQALLSATFNNVSFSLATTYLALYTVSPDKTGGGTEVSTSGTSYARQALSPTLSGGNLVYSPQDATGSTIDFADVTFPTASGSGFGTVVAIAICDTSSGGNILYYQTVTSTAVGSGITVTLSNGNLLVREA